MGPQTLTDIAFSSFDRFNRQDHFGYKKDGAWRTMTTLEARERARTLSGSLARIGIGRGDRVAIVSPTRLEWVLADYATLALGAAVVPIYPTLSAPQTTHILKHSGARLAFVAGAGEWAKLAAARKELPDLEHVVSFDPVPGDDAPLPLDAFLRLSGPYPMDGPYPDDLATIIYTSGTTGEPKGVMLTHANIVSNVLACTEICPFSEDDLQLSFLPLCHIFERMVHYYMLWNGVSIYFAEDISRVRDNLREVRPTLLTSVPRILEKVLEGVEEKGRRAGGFEAKVARFGVDVAREWARHRWGLTGDVPVALALKHLVAEPLVYRKVREAMGGRLRVIVTGGAAMPQSVAEFFLGVGFQVLPGYGLSETSPVVSLNTASAFALGSVGRPVPGVKVRIAEDGEILVQGANVMRGYYRNEAATRETFTADGWFKTGDVGELDHGGFLRITDRKKELLVTAGGKKIAPQPLEQALVADRFIAQVVLVGDGRAYVTALVVPRFAALEEWARDQGLAVADRAALLGRPDVQSLFRERIDAATRDLSRFETIKRFALLEQEFTAEAGELTPTLKVKKKVVLERRKELVESLYR